MSNAKMISLIADAHAAMFRDLEKILAPLASELARFHIELDHLQRVITPMAAELDQLKADVERLSRERGRQDP